MRLTNNDRKVNAFTLIEILIVVVILGVLAAIAIPQFANASDDAKESTVRSTLQTVRMQIELYRGQHGLLPPNLTSPAWSDLVTGNYLLDEPVNPYNGLSDVGTVASPLVGWVYDSATGDIDGVDASGAALGF